MKTQTILSTSASLLLGLISLSFAAPLPSNSIEEVRELSALEARDKIIGARAPLPEVVPSLTPKQKSKFEELYKHQGPLPIKSIAFPDQPLLPTPAVHHNTNPSPNPKPTNSPSQIKPEPKVIKPQPFLGPGPHCREGVICA